MEKTGLHRRSMYEEFGGKDGLFVACLDHFGHENTKNLHAILNQEPLGLSNIKNFFHDRIEYICSRHFKGCLLVKSAIEQPFLPPDAQKKLHTFLVDTEQAFVACLLAAQQQNEIRPSTNCQILAKYLVCFLQGLTIQGNLTSQKRDLTTMANMALATVKQSHIS